MYVFLACPPCYNLVQESVDEHRSEMIRLKELLDNITSTPTIVDDEEFEKKLDEVQERVDALYNEAKTASQEDGNK